MLGDFCSNSGIAYFTSYNFNGSGKHGYVDYEEISPGILKDKWTEYFGMGGFRKSFFESEEKYNEFINKLKGFSDYFTFREDDYGVDVEPGKKFENGETIGEATRLFADLYREYIGDRWDGFNMELHSEDGLEVLRIDYYVDEEMDLLTYNYATV